MRTVRLGQASTVFRVLALVLIVSLTLSPAPFAPASAAQTEIPQVEYEALVALWTTTGGPHSQWDTAWVIPTDTPCSLYGVTCSGGHVTALEIENNGLVGWIPAEIGNLSQLITLTITGGQLPSGIPAAIGSLANLRHLDLSFNTLQWSIPSSLGNLVNLRTLYLAGNNHTESIPPELGNLSRLESLSLRENKLSGDIPPELGKLSNLRWMDLSTNYLIGHLPREFGSLKKLRTLYLHNNRLTGWIPPDIGSMTSLAMLNLEANQLSSNLPYQLSNLANLEALYLGGNQFTGAIPPQLGNLPRLRYLELSANQLSGSIPPELGNLYPYQPLYPLSLSINLSNNQLSGRIPAELANLADITDYFSLGLSGNHLQGPIPSEIIALTNIDYLGLGYNSLWTADPAVQAFLDEKSPGWADTQSYAAGSLEPVSGGSVSLPAVDGTTLSVLAPAGAVDEAVDLVLSASPEPLNSPNSLEFAHQAFSIEAWQDGAPLASLAFNQPVTVTFTYTDPYIMGIFEETLFVFVREGNEWVDAADTCSPASTYLREPLENRISVPVCHLSEYALFGAPQVEIPQVEYDALAALHAGTAGAGWTNPWTLPTDTPCSLYGVTCSGGHVTGLALGSNNLIGALPSELGNLIGLTALDLSSNWLLGPVPYEMTSLSSLSLLDIGSNHLWTDLPDVRDFLDAHDPDWDDTQVVAVWSMSAETGGWLGLGVAGGDYMELHIPAGAITRELKFVIAPLPALPPEDRPAWGQFAGFSLSIGAWRDSVPQVDSLFSQPVIIQLTYRNPTATAALTDTLRFYLREGNMWVDAAETCSPTSAYLREPAENMLTVPVCRLGEFALFSVNPPPEPEPHRLFLPLALK